jgi:hypothetical protein
MKTRISNSILKRLPRNAYAYSNDNGQYFAIRHGESVASVIAKGNKRPLKASDYYSAPTDSAVVAEYVASRVSIAKQIESNYEG